MKDNYLDNSHAHDYEIDSLKNDLSESYLYVESSDYDYYSQDFEEDSEENLEISIQDLLIQNLTNSEPPPTKPQRFAEKMNARYIFLVCNEILYFYNCYCNAYSEINTIGLERLLVKEFKEKTYNLTSNQFERAHLHLKKLNISPDASSKALNNVNHLKAAIGLDRITGAYKGKDSFTFFCKTKFLISSNTIISSREYDPTSSFLDRLTILRFSVSIPPEQQNKNLEEDLLQEADSIFTASLHAFSRFLNNFSTFPVLDDTKSLLESILLDNPITQFIGSILTDQTDGYIFKFQIMDALEKFCKENRFELPGWNECKNMILTAFPTAKYKKIHKRTDPLNFDSPIVNRAGFTGIYFKAEQEENI